MGRLCRLQGCQDEVSELTDRHALRKLGHTVPQSSCNADAWRHVNTSLPPFKREVLIGSVAHRLKAVEKRQELVRP